MLDVDIGDKHRRTLIGGCALFFAGISFLWLIWLEAGPEIGLGTRAGVGRGEVSSGQESSERRCLRPWCFDVTEFGARGDAHTINTVAIVEAFAAAKAARGGTVYFPAGSFRTGPFDLVSNTTLLLDAGSTISFIGLHEDPDWPVLPFQEYSVTLAEAEEPLFSFYGDREMYRSLIGGQKLFDVFITGAGVIDGGGEHWYGRKFNATEPEAPNGIHILECKGLTITDISLKNFPKTTLRPQLCENVKLERMLIQSPADARGASGLVIDSSSHVLVRDSRFATGDKDDAISIKAGLRIPPGDRVTGVVTKRPSEEVLVERCVIKQGRAISIGSEFRNGIKRILFRGIEFDGRGHAPGVGSIQIKSERGLGGGSVGFVTFTDIRGWNVVSGLELYTWYQCEDNQTLASCRSLKPGDPHPEPPVFENITIQNVRIEGVTRHIGIVEGLPESPFTNLRLENFHVEQEVGMPRKMYNLSLRMHAFVVLLP
ncbi:hypothetical protein CYMTET_53631 [Cymbomonas tetramitiformis]|uniref:Rhamnogalacturonase A/B/Epimerase-like pectate lyase domain-containing protein n=1 Tax=Cymbomonas tetramitiformis TaxID=36881 RepID=A0AAE0EQ58_9CHLO|nr:hypothetical protein CYMTET_53631 [Cymbomonas tetramitiformis]